MSLVIKDSESLPAPTLADSAGNSAKSHSTMEEARAIVKRHTDEAIWDATQAKDVPAELVNIVRDRLEAGETPYSVRRALGIERSTDKSWRKIMSAINQGYRIDKTALLLKKGMEFEAISNKLRQSIMHAFETGIEVLNPATGEIVKLKGPSKELSGAVDAYNKLNQGFVKLGKDLGVFIEGGEKGGGSGGGGGVTIQILQNFKLPSQAEVDAHRESQKAKNQALAEHGKTIVTSGQTLPDADHKP